MTTRERGGGNDRHGSGRNCDRAGACRLGAHHRPTNQSWTDEVLATGQAGGPEELSDRKQIGRLLIQAEGEGQATNGDKIKARSVPWKASRERKRGGRRTNGGTARRTTDSRLCCTRAVPPQPRHPRHLHGRAMLAPGGDHVAPSLRTDSTSRQSGSCTPPPPPHAHTPVQGRTPCQPPARHIRQRSRSDGEAPASATPAPAPLLDDRPQPPPPPRARHQRCAHLTDASKYAQ